MWKIENTSDNSTNKVTVPTDGIISVTKPDSVQVMAYVNDAVSAVHHVHVKAGDSVYFKLNNTQDVPTSIKFDYAGETSELLVPANTEISVNNIQEEDNMTPAETINLFANPMGNGNNSGMNGAGLGAGILGGVLGGALLGGTGGTLGGNRGVGVEGLVTPTLLASELNRVQDNQNFAIAANERLTQSRFDAEAQREIQAAIERTAAATQLAAAIQSAALGVSTAKGQGEITTQVAATTGALGTQNALNAAALGVQVEKTAAASALALTNALSASTAAITAQATAAALAAAMNAGSAAQQLAAVNYGLATSIKTDGDLTRGILIAQNDAELNRRLIIAQNEITELRGDRSSIQRSREVEVNVSQSVNQNQVQLQQQQQQQQQAVLNAQIVAALQGLQVATATNQQLIIGNSGTTLGGAQTANPVNVRA